MSFLKITDPKKRDLMIKEFLETKKNIQQDQLYERVGEREFQKDLGKFFKPVTTAQEKTAEEIKEELKPLKEIVPAIEGIPGPFHAPLPLLGSQPILSLEEEEEKGKGKGKKLKIDMEFGPNAANYLGGFKDPDRNLGIYMKENKFYMGGKPIKIKGDNIIVGDNIYEGTKGLWELIMSKDPDKEIYNEGDINEYTWLMADTNAMYKDNDPENTHPKSSKSRKWKEIVSPIWIHRDYYKRKLREQKEGIEEEIEEESEEESEEGATGSGLSKDPNLLIERLDLLMESKKAGNTGVRNELISICDELKKQKILNTKQHKIILKKC